MACFNTQILRANVTKVWHHWMYVPVLDQCTTYVDLWELGISDLDLSPVSRYLQHRIHGVEEVPYLGFIELQPVGTERWVPASVVAINEDEQWVWMPNLALVGELKRIKMWLALLLFCGIVALYRQARDHTASSMLRKAWCTEWENWIYWIENHVLDP